MNEEEVLRLLTRSAAVRRLESKEGSRILPLPHEAKGGSFFGYDEDESVDFGPGPARLNDDEVNSKFAQYMQRVQREADISNGRPEKAPSQPAPLPGTREHKEGKEGKASDAAAVLRLKSTRVDAPVVAAAASSSAASVEIKIPAMPSRRDAAASAAEAPKAAAPVLVDPLEAPESSSHKRARRAIEARKRKEDDRIRDDEEEARQEERLKVVIPSRDQISHFFEEPGNLDRVGGELGRLIAFFQSHLSQHEGSMAEPPFTRQRGVEVWQQYAQAWNIENEGLNLCDYLFIAVCHAEVCRERKRADEVYAALDQVNIQKLDDAIRQLGRDWIKGPPVAPDYVDGLFWKCAVLVVFVYTRGPECVFDLALPDFEFRTNPFRKLPGDENNEARKEHQGTEDFTEAERSEYHREEVMRMTDYAISQMVSEFIPWCCRVFMNIWFDRMVLSARLRIGKSADTEESKQFRERSLERLTRWAKDEFTFEPSETFNVEFRDFVYKQETAIGSSLFTRRTTAAQDDVLFPMSVFQAENSDERNRGLNKLLETKPLLVFEDAKHPLRDHLIFFTMCYMFKHTFNGLDFAATYCIFNNDLHVRLGELQQIKNHNGVAKCPIVLQLGGTWYVHLAGTVLPQPSCLHAWVYWMFLVRHAPFKGSLDNGCEIEREWITKFLGPPKAPQPKAAAAAAAAPAPALAAAAERKRS